MSSMSINEVIKAGKDIKNPDSSFLGYLPLDYTLVAACMFAVSVIIFSIAVRRENNIKGTSMYYVSCILFVLSLTTVSFAVSEADNRQKEDLNNKIEEWKTSFVAPYLDNLEPKRTVVTNVKSYDDVGVSNYELVYFPVVDEYDTVRLQFELEGDYVRTESGNYLVKRDVKPEDDMYLEYRDVNKALGHGFDKGMYNAVLHVTKDTVID